MTIGFIGLGIMGKPMAANLMKAGHRLVVHDVARDRLAAALAGGAEPGTSPADVAARSELMITMLPNSPHVREVALGPHGIVEGARRGVRRDVEINEQVIRAVDLLHAPDRHPRVVYRRLVQRDVVAVDLQLQ